MLTLIVARANDGAIGRNGEIPWHAPEDLAMFQRETTGGAVIMGRNTWVSLPVKPLKNRMNCVVSRDTTLTDHVFGDTEQAVAACYAAGYHRIYGIGGAGIYAALLPVADRLLITQVDVTVPDADTHFPDIDPNQWNRIATRRIRQADPACRLDEYLRVRF
ncbi:dihydrofolate reductase [Loktanella sp. SALINAS62]|uniref:dihydrofolate reductase n=1 Tax=Loktanella sp. SALINAS62 TaxID=2706124 RepID=UPI001B8C9018|nr:dihydrofolate reductase [Loktanella sp. SALINAS62]MBS1304027.1 dihydrofolate reductase [Loktanella sp. SALINAS62]